LFPLMKLSFLVYLFVDCLKTLSTDKLYGMGFLYIKNFITYKQSIASYFIKYQKMQV
jgi:hypothetical protein